MPFVVFEPVDNLTLRTKNSRGKKDEMKGFYVILQLSAWSNSNSKALKTKNSPKRVLNTGKSNFLIKLILSLRYY